MERDDAGLPTQRLHALIDFANPHGPGGDGALRCAFGAPLRTLEAHRVDEVLPVLHQVQRAAQQGLWCVGYLRYEAAAAFDSALTVSGGHVDEAPLAWFGVHEASLPYPLAPAQEPAAVTGPWRGDLSRADFDRAMAHIARAIEAGEIYQLNFTTELRSELMQGSPLELFRALQRAQPGGYAAYIDSGHEQVLSVSPELFFDWDGVRLLGRPMKGTAARGATPEADQAQAERLHSSAKERAENVMIVDLIRNDLSRLAQPFSVNVPRLFHLEALSTVWQMTSDVEATTRDGTSLVDVFRALFPCGSITGAPKVQAMRLIQALEPTARGVYCGAVGVVRPGGAATFNVPIRTVLARGTQLSCGIGSGITSDATTDGEWAEWWQKRIFLERASAPFDLLETLALEAGTFRHQGRHLARLARAAMHFGYPLEEARLHAALHGLAQAHPSGLWRVRLLLNAIGEVQAQAFAMEPTTGPVTLALAPQALAEAHSEFVRFKTTRRAHYDAAAPTTPGVFDTILWNDAGEVTECARGNIAVQLDGRWVTPPLSSGLLDGVGREVALAEGRLQEAVVRVDDLPRATGLAFLNSLRGWIPATLG